MGMEDPLLLERIHIMPVGRTHAAACTSYNTHHAMHEKCQLEANPGKFYWQRVRSAAPSTVHSHSHSWMLGLRELR